MEPLPVLSADIVQEEFGQWSIADMDTVQEDYSHWDDMSRLSPTFQKKKIVVKRPKSLSTTSLSATGVPCFTGEPMMKRAKSMPTKLPATT